MVRIIATAFSVILQRLVILFFFGVVISLTHISPPIQQVAKFHRRSNSKRIEFSSPREGTSAFTTFLFTFPGINREEYQYTFLKSSYHEIHFCIPLINLTNFLKMPINDKYMK